MWVWEEGGVLQVLNLVVESVDELVYAEEEQEVVVLEEDNQVVLQTGNLVLSLHDEDMLD